MSYGKFDHKIYPDDDLAKILGSKDPVTNGEMIKKLWIYIKEKKLQK